MARLSLFVLSLAAVAVAQIDREWTDDRVRDAATFHAKSLVEVERAWLASLEPSDATKRVWSALFGYAPPGRALQLATLHAFLHSRSGSDADAVAAARYLARMADYRQQVPERLWKPRAEYADGLPAVPSFFQLADYAEAWDRVRACAAIEDATRNKVAGAIAGSAEFIFVFPEWGPHNRAMLRAECLAWCARALPNHPRAGRWRKMAEILAADSIRQWEIEDAQIYHPIWLLALFRWEEVTGDRRVWDSIQVPYYLRYFRELLAPDGTIPDFGDGWYRGGLSQYYACLEWGAARLKDPTLRWAARRVWEAMGPEPAPKTQPPLGRAILWTQLATHVDPALGAGLPPAPRTGPILDDVIGKKTVFRDGRTEASFYLLHTFRDEGDWGRLPRDYLRQSLAVEEEKMHHGQSDENSIVLMMDQGAVLLRDAGYRDVAPSGPFGAYRADIFHNRLVARRGVPRDGQPLIDFLHDAGAYRAVRSQRIDWASFELGDYSRTRLTDDDLGYDADRTIFVPRPAARGRAPRIVFVIDTVRVQDPGDYTFAQLFATQEVLATGPGWVTGRYTSIRGRPLPDNRHLLIVHPKPGTRPTPETFPLRRHTQDEHVAARSVSGHYRRGDHLSLVTILVSIAAGTDPTPLAKRFTTFGDGQGVAISAEIGADRWTLAVKTDLDYGLLTEDVRPRYRPDRGRFKAGRIRTDADIAILCTARGGTRWAATNLTHLHIGEQTAFEAKPMNFFQTSGKSDVVGRVKWRRWEDRLR
ncbi:MAG: hypothetical protein CMJ83_21595 [Planctomycetes bacterium]|nr:hypothetical protein [Planctomycetota bacterium]